MRRQSLSVFGLAALAFAALASASHAEDRALLIGVSDYPNLLPAEQLSGPRNDIEMMRDLLTATLGFSAGAITTLTDDEATKDGVEQAFRTWLIDGTRPGDRVFFYFSGHGIQVADGNGDEEDGRDEALGMRDLRRGQKGFENALVDDELDSLLGQLDQRFVTVVIDACHSGTATRSAGPVEPPEGARFLPFYGPAPKTAATRAITFETSVDAAQSSIVSFSASSAYQVAFEDMRLPEDERHGVFTGALVAGLKDRLADANGNGRVSYSELLSYTRQDSSDYCAWKPDCVELTPVLEAPDLAYQFEVQPRFTTKKPPLAVSQIDFNPPPERFTTAPEPVPASQQLVVDYLAANNSADVAGYDGVAETFGYLPDPRVDVALDPPVLKNNKPFRFKLNSGLSGQLLVYDIADSGEAIQIFPNELACKNTRIVAGRDFSLPDDDYCFELEAFGSGGRFLVVVVEDGVDIDQVAPKSYGLAETQSPMAVLARLTKLLAEPVVLKTGDGLTTRQAEWAYGLLDYAIE